MTPLIFSRLALLNLAADALLFHMFVDLKARPMSEAGQRLAWVEKLLGGLEKAQVLLFPLMPLLLFVLLLQFT
jgi:hypothetical protein